MINKKLYNIGTLGKPHSLNGYLYINHEIFFRIFSFKNKKVYINNREYEIKEIKKHLKNRFLVKILKIDNIDSAEKLRNYDVSISIEEIDHYMNNGLPNTLVFQLSGTPDDLVLFAATEIGPYAYSYNENEWFLLSGISEQSKLFSKSFCLINGL